MQLDLFYDNLTPSQLRSVKFLVSAKGWSYDAAVRYYRRHNEAVARRKMQRRLIMLENNRAAA